MRGIVPDNDKKQSLTLGQLSSYLNQSWVLKNGPSATIYELSKRGSHNESSNRKENALINVNLFVMVRSKCPNAVHKPIIMFPNHSGA